MDKYLIFVDVDGTLVVSGENEMDKRIPKLFEKIQSDGNVVAVVSGRALKGILAIDGIEKAKYICGLLGNCAIDSQTKEKVLEPKLIDSAIIKELINDINSFGLKWIYKDDFMEKSCFDDPEILANFSPAIVEESEFLKDLENSNIYQILIYGKVPEDIINKHTAFDFIEMPENYYDVTLKGASKANIVERLKSIYPNHIPVAIGDSANDIEMFKCCSIKIAMGGAKDQLKQISTYITKNVEKGGVVYAIKNILKL